MSSRAIIVIGLLGSLSTVAVATATFKGRNNKIVGQISDQQRVQVVQLPSQNGVPPVEILDEKVIFNSPQEMGGFSFTVKNNANKNIHALTVTYSLIYVSQRDGKEYLDSSYLTMNSYVHPDVTEAHHMKPIAPEEKRQLGKGGTMGYENAALVGLELKIDYVEFEDKTILGPNTAGSRIVFTMREGATKYKEWLVQQYKQNGGSVAAVISLLQSRDLPSDLAFNDMYLKEGARVYRRHMLDVYKKHGVADLERYLNR